jgi:D-serine deaminase-like pyridoxal phosphate-dependent protein
VGLTCATVKEADTVASFCDDILIANEVVTADACDAIAALARGRTVTVAVDSPAGLRELGAAARRAGVVVRVLVDVNVGQNRCGVAPGDPALALAQQIRDEGGVTLAGVMGYEGHAQPIADRQQRRAAAEQSMRQLTQTADLIRAEGMPCEIVSAGGTGTYDVSGRVPGVTEIQAGSYALMDSDYGRLDLPFEQALFLAATIISRPTDERIVADCGHKACSKDHGLPYLVGVEGAVVVGLNDEHATITVPAASTCRVGDRIRIRPSHVDPTVNLHDVIYALDGDRVVDVWRVSRGYAGVRRAGL